MEYVSYLSFRGICYFVYQGRYCRDLGVLLIKARSMLGCVTAGRNFQILKIKLHYRELEHSYDYGFLELPVVRIFIYRKIDIFL
jgi:hypothetical protein